MIVFLPLHKIMKYKKKRYDRSDRFYCCFRNRAVPCCIGIFRFRIDVFHVYSGDQFERPGHPSWNAWETKGSPKFLFRRPTLRSGHLN